MWEIYDAMIGVIPDNLIVDELVSGSEASYVRSGNGAGIAHYRNCQTRMPMFAKNLIGAPLREVAGAVKSWNLVEASVGLAALNAFYNNPETARANGVIFSDARRVEDRMHDPFIMTQNEVRGKKVGVIGRFPYLEKLFEPICDLAIISSEPREGDYPLPACEYILPECDYIYITCTCIVDKTLPRMLELARAARRVTVVGPATPLAPVLFNYGVHQLSGFIIKDNALACRVSAGAERVKLYAAGQKVSLQKS